MWPPGPVFPGISHGVSWSFPLFSHHAGKALLCCWSSCCWFTWSKRLSIAHTHASKSWRNNILLSHQQDQGWLFFFFFLSDTAKYELVYLIGEFHFGKTKDEVACSNEKHTLLQPTGHSQNAPAKKHLLLGGKTFFTLFSSQRCTDCHGVIPKLYNINERRIRTLFPKLVSNKYQHVFHPSPTHARGLQLFPLSF